MASIAGRKTLASATVLPRYTASASTCTNRIAGAMHGVASPPILRLQGFDTIWVDG